MGWNLARRMLVGAAAMVGAMVVAPSTARAVGWIQLPNGNWAYQTDYTTSAIFTCNRWLPAGSCHAFANGVRLTNGNSALTLTWTGVLGGTFNTAFSRQPAFSLGTLTKTVTGGPFVMPTSVYPPNWWLFQMTLDISMNPWIPWNTDPFFYRYRPSSPTDFQLNGGLDRKEIGGAQDPGTGFNGSVYLLAPSPTFDTNSGVVDYTAVSGIVSPEPATLALLGSGLLGLGGIAARRRRK